VASAPGKIIISGEHFVVHGAYSVAAAINRRVRVTVSEITGDSYISSGSIVSRMNANDGRFSLIKSIIRNLFRERTLDRQPIAVSVSSEIPPGSGLGSSAAVSVATAAAALKFAGSDTSIRKILEIALVGEKEIHGNPSGIDVVTSLRGGILLFSRNIEPKPIPLNRGVQFLVCYSGKPRRTGTLIDKVELKKKQFPNYFDSLTRSVSFLSLDVMDAITEGDLPRLGAIMNISQAALSWIGVSTPSIDRLIEEVASQEVFGVKLTGAGGGGCVIGLPKPDSIDSITKFASKNSAFSFITSIPQDGLRWGS
jgi:mevalonate kinase